MLVFKPFGLQRVFRISYLNFFNIFDEHKRERVMVPFTFPPNTYKIETFLLKSRNSKKKCWFILDSPSYQTSDKMLLLLWSAFNHPVQCVHAISTLNEIKIQGVNSLFRKENYPLYRSTNFHTLHRRNLIIRALRRIFLSNRIVSV